jgi:hypothetical protein
VRAVRRLHLAALVLGTTTRLLLGGLGTTAMARSSPSARPSNGTHLSLSKFWDGSWCKSQSLFFSFSVRCPLELLDPPRCDPLSRSERRCIATRFIAYIASCWNVIRPLELRKVTGRKCYWPGLEASLESAMGPWNFSPARYKGSLILGLSCTTFCPNTMLAVSPAAVSPQ